MEIRDYLENGGEGKIHVIGVNWLEGFFGDPGDAVENLARRIHPDIKLVTGTRETGRLFGDIRSVPAVMIFDGRGREVFRLGGDQGPNGRRQLHIDHIETAIRADIERAVKKATSRPK